jgi:hypothetical protein
MHRLEPRLHAVPHGRDRVQDCADPVVGEIEAPAEPEPRDSALDPDPTGRRRRGPEQSRCR